MQLQNYKFNFTGFARYLEGIAGGNRNKDASKAIVRDVQMFFQATPATSNSDIDRLFNKSNLEMFFQNSYLTGSTNPPLYQRKYDA